VLLSNAVVPRSGAIESSAFPGLLRWEPSTRRVTHAVRLELPLDALRATLELMEAPAEKIKQRGSYNLAGISFSPAEIAASWPQRIDDRVARSDWGWRPQYDLRSMVAEMLQQLTQHQVR